MMATKQKPCTLAPKHEWEHVKNVTFTNANYGPSGSRVKISYRGKYRCACGAVRYGIARDEQPAPAASNELDSHHG